MRKYVIAIWLLLTTQILLAQRINTTKQLVKNDSYKSWAKLSGYYISSNGKYISYGYQSGEEAPTNFICSSKGGFTMELPQGANKAQFSKDGTYAFFIANGNIGIMKAGNPRIDYIKGVQGLEYPEGGSSAILCFLKDHSVLKEFADGRESRLPTIKRGIFNKQGTALVLKTAKELIFFNISDHRQIVVAADSTADNIVFDESGSQVAFTTKKGSEIQINIYRLGARNAKVVISGDSKGIKAGFMISDRPLNFNRAGDQIVLTLLSKKKEVKTDSALIIGNVDVWHYKDARIQSNQLYQINIGEENQFIAVADIATNKIVQLETKDTVIVQRSYPLGKYVIMGKRRFENEAYWNESQETDYQLVSLETGARRTLVNSRQSSRATLSPSENYVTWFNTRDSSFYAHNISRNITKNITPDIPTSLVREKITSLSGAGPFPSVWIDKKNILLVYDNFDIWQVDPDGINRPICLTSGYGKKNNMILRAVQLRNEEVVFSNDEKIIIAGVSKETKHNGFFEIELNKSTKPDQLSAMEAGIYSMPWGDFSIARPEKAARSGTYLLTHQSAVLAPNLVVTKDFKIFRQITDLAPQSKYNWMTSEILSWKDNRGEPHQGILYKPENFDASQKYPVIFHYYQKRSDELYLFREPEECGGELSIPWYVSNGYLVFIPDMYFRSGLQYKDLVETVESGAKMLSKFPWVNMKKLGLQGHSFGGYETNLIISRSNIFAAAQSSAGMCNIISDYSNLRYGKISLQSYWERGQAGMKYSLWERPESYIENSPVLRADKISTPLLLQNNIQDDNMYFEGVQMFSALRRLKKPVWMLQYDGQDHILNGGESLDFSVRQQQFFDHYLKDKPAPIWMTQGIPAIYKGIESGLQLDTSGRMP